MISIYSRRFDLKHHEGWFKVYRFGRAVEIWFGKRYITIDWSR